MQLTLDRANTAAQCNVVGWAFSLARHNSGDTNLSKLKGNITHSLKETPIPLTSVRAGRDALSRVAGALEIYARFLQAVALSLQLLSSTRDRHPAASKLCANLNSAESLIRQLANLACADDNLETAPTRYGLPYEHEALATPCKLKLFNATKYPTDKGVRISRTGCGPNSQLKMLKPKAAYTRRRT